MVSLGSGLHTRRVTRRPCTVLVTFLQTLRAARLGARAGLGRPATVATPTLISRMIARPPMRIGAALPTGRRIVLRRAIGDSGLRASGELPYRLADAREGRLELLRVR